MSEELKHTPEPWVVKVDADNCASIEAGGMMVIPAIRDAKHDLELIVACVNACKGIPNEMLEAKPGAVLEIGTNTLSQEIATLRAEVERLTNDLADSLDCKRGSGPTALSMVIERAETAEAKVKELEAIRKEQAIDQESILKSHTEEQDRADKAEVEVKRLQRVLGIDKAMADPNGWNHHRAIIADIDKKLETAEANVLRLREALEIIRCHPSATEYIFNTAEDALDNGTGQGEKE